MFRVVPTNRFEKKLKKITFKSQEDRKKIVNLLVKLSQNPFEPSLNTHKLSGKLDTIYSISCGFDCRILFSFEVDSFNEKFILLLDIGKHDVVY